MRAAATTWSRSRPLVLPRATTSPCETVKKQSANAAYAGVLKSVHRSENESAVAKARECQGRSTSWGSLVRAQYRP